jgi:hypothetical protein
MVSSLSEKRGEQIMRTIASALLALSMLAGMASIAGADSVGPPTYWTPQDTSKSPN